jgi:predicted O-methyltransferase YrrM
MLRYPQILFHASKTINKGTLVYADIIVPGDIADDLMEFDASVDTDDKLQDMESYIESKFDNVSNVLLTSYFMLQWK